MSSTFAALGEPNYRLYFSGALVSNIGTWMQRVTQSWMGACALILGVLAVLGVARTWHVYLIALLFAMASALDMPARQAFVSEMVPTNLIPNAVALNSASFSIGRLIGPAVGGLVIAAWGSGWAILTNAVTYTAFLIGLSLMNSALPHPPKRVGRSAGQIRAGLRYLKGRPDLLAIFGVAFCVGTFAMNFQRTNALMAQQEFGQQAEGYGVLGSALPGGHRVDAGEPLGGSPPASTAGGGARGWLP